MTMRATMRAIWIGLAALSLAGCAGGGLGGLSSNSEKPKVVLVADFAASPDVDAIDRGFSVRMDKKDPNYPLLERKRRTLARVNDEIVAAIVATVREAGLNAEPGSEDSLSLKENAVLISGHLRAASLADLAKHKKIGFGPGYGGVAADMTLSRYFMGGKKQLLAFAAQAPGKAAPLNRKEAAAREADVDAALGAEGTAAVKLSPETQTQARRLGRAIGDKFVAFAHEQGWFAQGGEPAQGEQAEPVAPAAAESTQMSTPIPPRRPAPKSAPKPVPQITPDPKPKPEQPPA
jgi:hypothetical protein